MATLEWATLVVVLRSASAACAGCREGPEQNRFLHPPAGDLCSMLAVSGLYEAIDGVLGGWHVTSLILRYLVFATVLLVGLRVTQGTRRTRGYSLIAGRAGRWALALCCLAVTVTFLLMDTTGVSAGLQTLSDTGEGNAALAPYYTAAGRSYPAFVSLVLVPPLLAAVRSRQPRLVRAGALLVLLGAVFAIMSFPVSLAPAAGPAGSVCQLCSGPGLCGASSFSGSPG